MIMQLRYTFLSHLQTNQLCHDLCFPFICSVFYVIPFAVIQLVEKPFDILPEAKVSGGESSKPAESTKTADLRQNVYEFGILLLETITGRLPDSENQLVDWVIF